MNSAWRLFVILPLLGLSVWLVQGWRGIDVAAITVARGNGGGVVEVVYATGFVEPVEPVSVSSRLTAPVARVLVEEGQAVRRGEPLVVLDDAEQQGLLTQAAAQSRAAGLEEQRTTTLFRQGWVTAAARDNASANGAAARAAVDAARARLEQTTVRAGIAGVVLKRDVYPGDLATPGKELLQLGDPARLRVTATVDERDIPRVAVGQPAVMSSDAMPGRVIHGHVTEITPAGDPNQRAFRVRILPDDRKPLPLGLTLEVNIVVRKDGSGITVPNAALVDGHAIWVVIDGHARRRPVTIGARAGQRTEIRTGLVPGDIVIAAADPQIHEGGRVRPLQ